MSAVAANHSHIQLLVDALLAGRVELDDGDIFALLGKGLGQVVAHLASPHDHVVFSLHGVSVTLGSHDRLYSVGL